MEETDEGERLTAAVDAVALGVRMAQGMPTLFEYVLRYGEIFEPSGVESPLGEPKKCFENSGEMALEGGFTYCEGFAISNAIAGMFGGQKWWAVHHAWILDDDGRAVETTWDCGGFSYFGIPYSPLEYIPLISECGYYDVLKMQAAKALARG